MAADGEYLVLLYYLYTTVSSPEEMVARQRALCEGLGLRGRIIVSGEGINGTVSGPREGAEAYMREMHGDPVTAAVQFKIEECDGYVSPKISVKVRAEVVTLGLPEGNEVDPRKATGVRLSPKEFEEAMADPEAILLDGRNDYESVLGRFRGALCPEVEHFRDFPRWIRENLGHLKERPVLTYCTGGIRCEKLSAFLLEEGFERVFQLEGGIINYSQDETTRGRGFEGLCYVFDRRIGVEVDRTQAPSVISRCRHCGELSPRYRNCTWAPCNAQFFCCEDCEEAQGRFCSEECSERIDNQVVG